MSDCDSPTKLDQVDQVADSEEPTIPTLPWPNYQKYF